MIIYPHDPRYTFNIREDQPTDAVVIREIWCENTYEVYDGDLSDTHIVIDAGANIGAFSIYMHSLNPEAKVYAFEPELQNYHELLDNIKLNKLEGNIVPIQAALGEREGNTVIDDNGGDSRIGKGSQPVHVTTLADFWKKENLEFIDVLKIDVEGYEANVLRGMADNLFNLCRYIIVEYDRQSSEGDFSYIVSKLSETHQLKIVGSHKRGAYIFAHRY